MSLFHNMCPTLKYILTECNCILQYTVDQCSTKSKFVVGLLKPPKYIFGGD